MQFSSNKLHISETWQVMQREYYRAGMGIFQAKMGNVKYLFEGYAFDSEIATQSPQRKGMMGG